VNITTGSLVLGVPTVLALDDVDQRLLDVQQLVQVLDLAVQFIVLVGEGDVLLSGLLVALGQQRLHARLHLLRQQLLLLLELLPKLALPHLVVVADVEQLLLLQLLQPLHPIQPLSLHLLQTLLGLLLRSLQQSTLLL
jgi:hypothetical protein